ncbi:hypothetical protein [Stenotrophomonas indicatrix]|uniref:hypothetical protein n=1 Tax=Stenotrophomonas indicatrix TaxID=2045451 RepID=UPI00320AADAE
MDGSWGSAAAAVPIIGWIVAGMLKNAELFDQVTGLIDGMKVGDLNQQDGTSMGALADAIEALPDNFSRAVFDLVVDNNAQPR